MADNFVGPYMVLERSTTTFKLEMGKRVEVVSTDQWKYYVGLAPLVAAQPPCRGLPLELDRDLPHEVTGNKITRMIFV